MDRMLLQMEREVALRTAAGLPVVPGGGGGHQPPCAAAAEQEAATLLPPRAQGAMSRLVT